MNMPHPKPPLGVKSESVWLHQRASDLMRAIIRYEDHAAIHSIPLDKITDTWTDQLIWVLDAIKEGKK